MAENGLRSFGGEPAPVMVVDGWNRYCRFPVEAREPFLDLLRPVILDPANPAILGAVRDLATNQGLREEDVSAALQAGSILYTQVGALDLASEDLKSDLEALSRGEAEASTAFLTRFDATKQEVRNAIIQGTLHDHGKVLVGLDWRVDLDKAWKSVGHDVPVMGNLDPIALFGDAAHLRREAERILNQAEQRPGHIFNLGHGILPQTPVDNVCRLIDLVHELSRR